ncbi:APC family permease [Metaclostridioides mangenotii]|uniref:APA family basic amino acid/polyamine antiporter n=1 Tax=Metaclostridioides mangenotii TaxID=1540 RepID=A0ABS4E8M4_9FIRM|nr:amino acid permease [Clostridioides mangenotii]MBP1854296.1 APA family basic amino acid/polyamine antiporter [Clostridioides mangenotii]
MSNELKKTLGLSAAMSTVIGSVIGSGVFFKPQAVYALTGGEPGLGMLAWLFAGLMTIAAGLTAAEVAAMIPKTGGMMVYIKEIYGDKLGFLAGWMQIVLFFPGMAAALAVIFAQQFTEMIGATQFQLPVAIGLIIIVAFLNTMGSKTAGGIQTVSTVCKLIPLVVIMVFGFIKGSGEADVFRPLVGSGVSLGSVIGQVLIAILFAYEGWMNVGAIAGEMKNPGKDLPRAIIGGLTITTAVYFVINLAYLWVLPASQLALETSPASAVATKIFGDVGGTIISVGILISVFGTLNGYLLTGPRVVYTLAEDKTLPFSDKLAKLNGAKVPANAIIFMATIAGIYALTNQFNLLTDLAVFASWLFYVLTFIGVIKLRKTQPDTPRSYKVPLYPIIPLIAIISGSFVLINLLLFSGWGPRLVAFGSLGITALGLPIYLMNKKN